MSRSTRKWFREHLALRGAAFGWKNICTNSMKAILPSDSPVMFVRKMGEKMSDTYVRVYESCDKVLFFVDAPPEFEPFLGWWFRYGD